MTPNSSLRIVGALACALATSSRAVPAAGALARPVQTPARAAADTALALDAAVQRALAHFPSLAAARAQSAEADAAAGEAAAARFPSLRVGASATRFEEAMLVSPIHGFTPGTTPPFDDALVQSQTTLSYTLFDGGARGGRIRRAREQAEAADASRAGTEQALLARVVATYLGVLGDRQVLDAHDRRLAALREELGAVRRRFDAGRAARVEILRVEAAIATAEAERVRLAYSLEIVQRDLARLTAMERDAVRAERLIPVALTDTTLPPRDAQEAQVRETNAVVQEARRAAAAADAAVGVARGARWPELRVVGTYLTYGDGDLEGTGEWNAGVQLQLPLFTGGAVVRGIDRAEAARRAAHARARLAELEAMQGLDRARSALEEARARAASLDLARRRSAEVARIERLRLETGVGTQVDYLNAEAELLAAQAAWVEAYHRTIAARVDLARVTGDLTPDWLAANLENTR